MIDRNGWISFAECEPEGKEIVQQYLGLVATDITCPPEWAFPTSRWRGTKEREATHWRYVDAPARHAANETEAAITTHLDPDHAAIRLALANLTGAASGVLTAIHRAGGWHVFDPEDQHPMQSAMQALEQAVLVAIESQNGD